MAVEFHDSFDLYTTLLQRWSSLTGSGSITITASNGRHSTAGLVVNAQAGAERYASKTLTSDYATVYVGFGFKCSALPSGNVVEFLYLKDISTIQIAARLRTDGRIDITRGAGTGAPILATTSGAAALSANVWYHFEFKIVFHNSTGTVDMWINEVNQATATGLDTVASSNSYANVLSIGRVTYSGGEPNDTFYLDDVVVATTGPTGDVSVRAFLPTGIGATNNWTPTGAASNNAATDDAAPNDDTDYMSTTVTNDLTLFTYDDITAGQSIVCVTPMPYAKKTDAGTAKIKSTVRHSGVNYDGAEKAPSDSSYSYHPDILMVNPGTSAAWTVSDFNAIEIGVKRTA